MKRPRLFDRPKAPRLVTARLDIRLAAIEDAGSLARFFSDNRAHFEPWDPPAPEARFTAAYWEPQIKRSLEDWRSDRSVRLHLFLRDIPDRVIGRVGFSQIARGPFQSCMLGYQIAREYEGQGLMHEALLAATEFMFKVHGVHRIQANYLPENARSAKLLERLGFLREGLARDYLFIAGSWRDHVLTALTDPSFDQSRLT
jgi:ribosomal-protein-alanine N-acetyltransferase